MSKVFNFFGLLYVLAVHTVSYKTNQFDIVVKHLDEISKHAEVNPDSITILGIDPENDHDFQWPMQINKMGQVVMNM